MLFVTGDIHGGIQNFIQECLYKNIGLDDYVIIAGDFGGVWFQEDKDKDWYDEAEAALDDLNEQPWITLFIDGNHENFDRLYSYPVKEWNGGKVHVIRPNVLHLMRGEIFDIEGKSILAMGGAASHDISQGIIDLDEYEMNPDFWDSQYVRVNNYSWWAKEKPTYDELQNCLKNLSEKDFKVDYVITHEAPYSFTNLVFELRHCIPDDYSKWLEQLKWKLDYKKFFCGHYHLDVQINEKDYILYNKLIAIA